jgi:predicted ester cyclase
MPTEENKELVRRFFTGPGEEFIRQALKTENPMAVLMERTREDFSELLTPDFKIHSTFGNLSLEEYVQNNVMTCLAIPDVSFPIDHMVAEDDKVMIRFTMRGTFEGKMQVPPWGDIQGKGNKLNCAGVYTCRFTNGKIAEAWALYDTLTLMQQIGVFPNQ